MNQSEPLSDELRAWILRIEDIARGYGLDPFPTIFEMVDYEQMNMFASYEGFPIRYRHWRWGMEYERLSKSFAYGLHKIYELVINTDPCFAYLLNSNTVVDHKLVIAHVYGHSDFFKHNAWFAHTDRKMLDTMANNASKVARLAERHGHEKVEAFIDLCLSIDNLIDYHSPYINRPTAAPDEEDDEDVNAKFKLPARNYMDRYINPEEDLERKREAHKKEQEALQGKFPVEPEKDVMLFLLEHAPLAKWQRQILSIVRSEAYYFVPQRMTKIMNEGWASYWHAQMMTHDICDDTEIIDFACTHSGTMQMSPNSFNPYKIGIELYRDIEDRWNKGRFGLEYDSCATMAEKSQWDLDLGLGREKIFQVRRIYNDVTFLDEFLTPEFCERQKLFTFGYDRRKDSWQIKSKEFKAIKEQLLSQLTNFGQPAIYVEDANYHNRGELMLWHKHDGKDLKPDYGHATLENLVKFWGRPVHIRTETEGKTLVWTHNGEEFVESTSES